MAKANEKHMDVDFECPHCGQLLVAALDFIDREIHCPACKEIFEVPQPPPPPLPLAVSAVAARDAELKASQPEAAAPPPKEEKKKKLKIKL